MPEMGTEETREQQLARLSAEAFSRRVEDIAGRLVRIAEKIRNEDSPSFIDRATYIQHEVLWGVANLSLDNLPRHASEADRNARQAHIAGGGAR